ARKDSRTSHPAVWCEKAFWRPAVLRCGARKDSRTSNRRGVRAPRPHVPGQTTKDFRPSGRRGQKRPPPLDFFTPSLARTFPAGGCGTVAQRRWAYEKGISHHKPWGVHAVLGARPRAAAEGWPARLPTRLTP